VLNPFIALQILAMDLTDRLKRDEKGASAVEYALLVAGIAVIVVAALKILGPKVDEMFEGINVTGS